jgi:TPR repeat protein
LLDRGDPEARYNYGVMRLTGQDGQPPDPAAAHGHFEAAAAQEFAPGMWFVVVCLLWFVCCGLFVVVCGCLLWLLGLLGCVCVFCIVCPLSCLFFCSSPFNSLLFFCSSAFLSPSSSLTLRLFSSLLLALNGLGIGPMGKGNGMATGQPPDFTKAKEYFHRAAKQNSADGHFNLGALYKDGQGVEQVRGYT